MSNQVNHRTLLAGPIAAIVMLSSAIADDTTGAADPSHSPDAATTPMQMEQGAAAAKTTATRASSGTGGATPSIASFVDNPQGSGKQHRKSRMTQPPSYLPVESLTVAVGQIQRLPVKGQIRRVAVGNGGLLSTTVVDANLLVIAEGVGTTNLMIWTDDTVRSFKVHVVPYDLEELRVKAARLMAAYPRVKADIAGSDVVLSGYAHAEELKRIGQAVNNLPGVINNVLEDQGSATTRSVLFKLSFVEVKRSYLEQLGIQWAQSANGPVFGTTGVYRATGPYAAVSQPVTSSTGPSLVSTSPPPFTSLGSSTGGYFLGLASYLNSALKLGSDTGDTRVLATPELVARSGGKADMNVGGEVPIPMAGAFGSTSVIFKPYGVLFSIEPQVSQDNIISAKISTEVSQIDNSVSVGGIPGFLTRKTAAEISIKPGEVVALAGLLNDQLSNSISSVPGLGNLPILGRLFRSDDFIHNKTDLVVLLEPEIVTPGQGLVQQLKAHGADVIDDTADRSQALNEKSTLEPLAKTAPTAPPTTEGNDDFPPMRGQ
ncbi:MAG: pilus assembly protein N-terminal domain-containing protein [Burkholderiales bacterium]|nr:pilus assembly protein N-terminal domain-containing protein [Burkholderiales bacterium]